MMTEDNISISVTIRNHTNNNNNNHNHSSKISDKSTNKNIFLIEGGGTKGIYGGGVLKYLLQPNDCLNLKNVQIFGGTSVGSYFALALSLGYDINDLDQILKNLDLSNLIDSKYLFMLTVYRFLSKSYLYDDTGRQNIIKTIMNIGIKKIQNDLGIVLDVTEFTFSHLKKLIELKPDIYKHLIVNMVDLSRSEQIFMTTLDSKSNNIKIFDALLMSSSIPFVFKPFTIYHYEDDTYGYEPKENASTLNRFVDGGLCNNNPLSYFLLQKDQFNDYNIWLMKFTKQPSYVNINSNSVLLEQIISYLFTGKNDVVSDLIHQHYNISVINLFLTAGTLDIYTPQQIQYNVECIYNKCVNGELYFGDDASAV